MPILLFPKKNLKNHFSENDFRRLRDKSCCVFRSKIPPCHVVWWSLCEWEPPVESFKFSLLFFSLAFGAPVEENTCVRIRWCRGIGSYLIEGLFAVDSNLDWLVPFSGGFLIPIVWSSEAVDSIIRLNDISLLNIYVVLGVEPRHLEA